MTTVGAVATPHVLATEAGRDAYAQGGNAIDAALAAAAVLTVVYPHNTALGGDLVALVRTPAGEVFCVNATGPSLLAHSADGLRQKHGDQLPVRGPDVITVPGGVRGWEELRRFGARLPWSSQFEAAIRHAAGGVPVARSVAKAIVDERAKLERDPGSAALFLPGGHPLERGALLRQPELATSLRSIANRGADEFYRGKLASALVRGLRKRGCPITMEDLADFRPEVVAPLATTFAGHEVLTSPPNTQGFALIRTLRAIRRVVGDAVPLDLPTAVPASLLARLFRNGAIMRDTMLADPHYSDIDLEAEGFEELVESLSAPREKESESSHRRVLPTGDTVGIATADSSGFAVSLIQSVYYSFGATVLEPSTGIQLQNRGMSFSLDPESPNRFEPGKRPRHTLMPVMVTDSGRVRWVNSTMGGHAQAQIHAQVLLTLLGGATPQEAVTAPRWVVGPRNQADPEDKTYFEQDVPKAVTDSLVADDFLIESVPARSDWIGHTNVVSIDSEGVLTAGSDPRADGSAGVTPIGAV